jgi:[protein-PII] uridylyltransferase
VNAAEVLAARTAQVEERLRAGWRMPPGFALLAVGGFGRRELFPHSDVDLVVLAESDALAREHRDAIGAFLQPLWDEGLRPSHAVHTIASAARLVEGNAELTVSLLDQRLLEGDAALFARFTEEWTRFLRGQHRAVARRLAGLTEHRHARAQRTVFHLEPNIKESPGGLRDLQTLAWLAKLGRPAPPPLDRAREFLFGLRIRLHSLSRRDDNRLSFDAQEAISGQPAELMRSYYRHARSVFQALRLELESLEEPAGSLLSGFREFRARLSNADFTVSRNRVFLRTPGRVAEAAYRWNLFRFVARHGLPLAAESVRRLGLTGALPAALEWSHWADLLGQPHAAQALRAMLETGALPLFLREWTRIDSLVVRDFYHRYTVDEHTVVAVEMLDRIEDPRFRGLLAETAGQLPVLRFALLLHDIGKDEPNHLRISVDVADVVLSRLRAPEAEAATVCFLIRNHLELSQAMARRDPSDPQTARDLAARVGTPDRLKLLTLLTYADISAVDPELMTPFRRDQLWNVFRVVQQEMTRELAADRIRAAAGLSPAEQAWLDGFPARYLRLFAAEEIAAHRELAAQLAAQDPAVALAAEPGGHRLTIAAADRTFLLARASAALAACGMNIRRTDVFINRRGVALLVFRFEDPLRTLAAGEDEPERLLRTVRQALTGKLSLEKLLERRRSPARPAPRGETSVEVRNDVSDSATLLELTAPDRPGLLSDFAQAISESGCNIEVVLADTTGRKAMDIFYVTHKGGKVPEAMHAALRDALERKARR